MTDCFLCGQTSGVGHDCFGINETAEAPMVLNDPEQPFPNVWTDFPVWPLYALLALLAVATVVDYATRPVQWAWRWLNR